MSQPLTFDLPLPPSANHLFAQSGNRRVKTVRYRSWLREAGWRMVGSEMPEKTPLSVEILASINRKRDIDNLIKPILDSLQKSLVIADDRWVDFVSARRVVDGEVEDGYCRVVVQKLNP